MFEIDKDTRNFIYVRVDGHLDVGGDEVAVRGLAEELARDRELVSEHVEVDVADAAHVVAAVAHERRVRRVELILGEQ
jgi:hypothetical protein